MTGNRSSIGVTDLTAILALFIGLVSLGFTLYWNSPLGEVQPVNPSGYALMRGLQLRVEGAESERLIEAPSDHVVLEVEWQNDSGSAVLIKEPELIVHELDENGRLASEEPQTFFLAGEYPELSTTVLATRETNPYTLKSALVLGPHSVSQHVLVFRVKKYLGENLEFRFEGDKRYRVDVQYRQVPTVEILQIPRGLHWGFVHIAGESMKNETLLRDLRTHQNVDCLQLYGEAADPNENCPAHKPYIDNNVDEVPAGYGWDYWSLVPGARE